MKIEDAKPGMRVVYKGYDFSDWGNVSSKNDRFIFVKFDEIVAKMGWEGTTAQACYPEDLSANCQPE